MVERMVIMSEFGDFIKQVRDSKGLTLNQVALKADISSAQLSRIETGKRGVPKPPTIRKISDALKIDYDELMKLAGYIEHEISIDKDEKDIAKRIEDFKKDIESQDGLSFMGEPMSDEAKESLVEAMEHLFRQTQRINKKYIPKKFREEDKD